MRRCSLLALLGMWAGCGASESSGSPDGPKGADWDYDGFPLSEDCDDGDPYVHPGAHETPGDGVDSDCDGADGDLPYVGAYDLAYFMAGFSGFPILVEGSESGAMEVAADLSVELWVASTISEDAVGFELPIEVALTGQTVPLEDPRAFVMEATGEWREEEVFVSWECMPDEDSLDCFGALKLLGYGFENEARFEAE